MSDQPPSPPPPTGKPHAGRVSGTRIVLRVLLCSLGALVAVAAASVVATFGLYRGLEGDPAYDVMFLITSWMGTALLLMGAGPVLALYMLGTEIIGLRGLVWHMLGGMGLMLALAFGLVDPDGPGSETRYAIAAAAGIAGGFVYWAIAGRTAGRFRERLYMAARDGRANGPASPEA